MYDVCPVVDYVTLRLQEYMPVLLPMGPGVTKLCDN